MAEHVAQRELAERPPVLERAQALDPLQALPEPLLLGPAGPDVPFGEGRRPGELTRQEAHPQRPPYHHPDPTLLEVGQDLPLGFPVEDAVVELDDVEPSSRPPR
jgi:hypothetical protein